MSSSKIIPRERLTAFEKWELPHMKSSKKRPPEKVEEGPRPPTAEEIARIQREAYAEGFEQGRKEGREAGQTEVHATLQRLERIIHALAAPLDDVDQTVEEELVALALSIARQIIRRELKHDPGQVVAVVREALAALPAAARRIDIYLHPDDVVLVREAMPAGQEEETRWRLHEEPTLTRGGCRVATEHSRIDASVEQRIHHIATRLLGGERKDDRVGGAEA